MGISTCSLCICYWNTSQRFAYTKTKLILWSCPAQFSLLPQALGLHIQPVDFQWKQYRNGHKFNSRKCRSAAFIVIPSTVLQLQSYKNIFYYYPNTMFEKQLLTNATVQYKQISHSWFCGGPSPAWIGSKYFDLSWTLWWDGIEGRLWGYGTASMLISVKTNFWHLCHFRYDNDERQKIGARSIFIYHHYMQHIEQIQINGTV